MFPESMMPMMDLKSRHASWLDYMCQKFETICHEVDNFVSQETVKYVENQVQSVGQSTKTVHSDVVEDIVPPVDPVTVKLEAQAGVLSKNAATDTYLKSKIGSENLRRRTVMKTQSSTLSSDSDPSIDGSNNIFGKPHLVNQLTPAIGGQCVMKIESGSALEKLDNVSAKNGSVMTAEENEIKSKSTATEVFEFKSSGKRECFEASFSSKPIAYDFENTNAQGAGSIHQSMSAFEDSILNAQQNEIKRQSSAAEVFELNSSGKSECFEASFTSEPIAYDCENTNSQVTGTVHQSMSVFEDSILNSEQNEIKRQSPAIEVLDVNSLGKRESYEASFSSEPITCDYENTGAILDEGSVATSFHGDEFQSLEEATKICDDPPDDLDHGFDNSSSALSEMAFSIVSSDEKLAEMDFVAFMTHFCTELHCPSNKSDNSIRSEELNYGNCADSLPSATSFTTLSSMSEVAEKGLVCSYSALSLDSLGCSDSVSYITDRLNESEMETIDLSDKVKLEDSCAIDMVDDKMLHEVSRRTRKLRSYKKKIQDIFASKKRLTKEYEMLAIWYGDCDTESSQEALHNRPSSSNSPACNNLRTQQLHDSEWELL